MRRRKFNHSFKQILLWGVRAADSADGQMQSDQYRRVRNWYLKRYYGAV